jgi:hypothetical protein
MKIGIPSQAATAQQQAANGAPADQRLGGINILSITNGLPQTERLGMDRLPSAVRETRCASLLQSPDVLRLPACFLTHPAQDQRMPDLSFLSTHTSCLILSTTSHVDYFRQYQRTLDSYLLDGADTFLFTLYRCQPYVIRSRWPIAMQLELLVHTQWVHVSVLVG